MSKNPHSNCKIRRLSLEQLETRELLAVDVTVNPFDHQQEFLGGGAGFTLYSGHLVNGLPAAQRPEVYDWLFRDLNLPDLRIFSFRGEASGNDNDDPFDLDLEAMQIPTRDGEFTIYQEALARNPGTRVMAYTNTHPDFLKNPDGSYNTSFPNFYEELAEYLYGNLAITKLRYGVQVDIIDILNEPDFSSSINRALATEIVANTIPALQNLVTTNFATYGVEMPIIAGFSTGTVATGNNWLSGLESDNQQAWDNLDYLTVHPYGGGGSGFVQSHYADIAALRDADHPIFIQNEMEFGHSSFLNNDNSLPEDLADDELEAALALSRIFAMSVEAGADGFHVFQGNNPNSQGGKSLVFSPWGQTAVRRTGYFAYQQLSSLQPKGSDVVTDVTTGAPEGVHTLAYNKWGDNQVYLNLVNATSNDESASIRFNDNAGGSISFQHIKQVSTSGTEHSAVVIDQGVTQGTTVWNTTIPAHSVQTFVVTLDSTGYAVPVGDLTYIRETSGSSLNTTPQDGDTNPRTEFLVGLNGNGADGSQRGEMRALMEFDLSNLGIPPSATVNSARLEMRAYRGSVGGGESISFDVYEYGSDFVEAQATWVDPDGDGSTSSGDTTPGGSLGNLLGSSEFFDGDASDYNDGGTSEIFHQRVIVDGNSNFTDATVNASGDELRLVVRPRLADTTNAEFFGFFDEESPYAPELIVTAAQNDFDGPTIASTTFHSETDQSFDITFSEEIDVSTLGADDFVFENLDFGITVSGSRELFLIDATSTSATVRFRELPLIDGEWEFRLNAGAYADVSGNSNAAHSFFFSVLNGDFNADGDVDGSDFLTWQRGLGTPSPLATASDGDADRDLAVTPFDRAFWQANYGINPSPAIAAASAASVYPALDLAKFQTTTASSSAGGTIPNEATDGIVSNDSRWYSQSGAGPHWIEVELTTPYPVGSAQLFLGNNDDSTVPSFEIQYHNGFSWQTISSVTGNTATDVNLVFPSPIETATRFRFYTTENIARVKEFVLLPPNDGVGHALGTDVDLNLATKRAAFGSSVSGSNYAINAIDGSADDSSRWAPTDLFLTNGNFEESTFDLRWTNVNNLATSVSGIAPGSSAAVMLPGSDVGAQFYQRTTDENGFRQNFDIDFYFRIDGQLGTNRSLHTQLRYAGSAAGEAVSARINSAGDLQLFTGSAWETAPGSGGFFAPEQVYRLRFTGQNWGEAAGTPTIGLAWSNAGSDVFSNTSNLSGLNNGGFRFVPDGSTGDGTERAFSEIRFLTSFQSAGDPSYVIDDVSLSPAPTASHNLEVAIPTIHEVGSIHVHSGTAAQNPLSDFTIEYANGGGWLPIPGGTASSGSIVGDAVTGNTSSELVVQFSAPVSANKLRVSFDGDAKSIRELVVLPANITDTGTLGYPIGTSVTAEAKPSVSFADYGDDWHRIAARTNDNSLITTDTGSSQADAQTPDDAKRFQLLYSYALDAYQIRNQDTGKSIEVENGSSAAGAAIVEGVEYTAAPHQLWRLLPTDSGYYQIVNVWSGMVLQTDSGSPALVTQQPRDTSANPSDAQEWRSAFQDDYFKKGTGGWVGQYNTGWAYNWARSGASGNTDKDFFYVPMQHREGWPNLTTLHEQYHFWNSSPRPSYLLGFNEPDRPDQANMTVNRGVELWPWLTALDVPLVSPAPALGGEDWWLNNFMDQTDALGYRVDYAGGHWYSSPSR